MISHWYQLEFVIWYCARSSERDGERNLKEKIQQQNETRLHWFRKSKSQCAQQQAIRLQSINAYAINGIQYANCGRNIWLDFMYSILNGIKRGQFVQFSAQFKLG